MASELAPESAWFKSSYSSGSEGNCVQAADLKAEVGIRDSKHKEGPALVFRRSAWAAFVAGFNSHEFHARA
jgi:hypothetical protein